MTRKNLMSLLLYFCVGITGIVLAASISSFLFSKVQANEGNGSIDSEQSNTDVPTDNLVQENTTGTGPVQTNENSGIIVEGQKNSNINLSDIFEDYNYNPEDKKDPFLPYEAPSGSTLSSKPMGPVKPLQNYDLDQLSVTGIIWGVENPMAMINAPNGEVFYVKEREKLGKNNGYIAKIREGEIAVVESFVVKGEITSVVKILSISSPQKVK